MKGRDRRGRKARGRGAWVSRMRRDGRLAVMGKRKGRDGRMGKGFTWNALLRLTFFSAKPSPSESKSLASSPFTFAELFFLLEFVFFFIDGAFLTLLLPRVDRPRRFSSACNRAAKAASSSSWSAALTFFFFLGMGAADASGDSDDAFCSSSSGGRL